MSLPTVSSRASSSCRFISANIWACVRCASEFCFSAFVPFIRRMGVNQFGQFNMAHVQFKITLFIREIAGQARCAWIFWRRQKRVSTWVCVFTYYLHVKSVWMARALANASATTDAGAWATSEHRKFNSMQRNVHMCRFTLLHGWKMQFDGKQCLR